MVGPKLLIKVRMAQIRPEADAIKSFYVEPVARPELPPYRGGAHVIVQFPDGARRNYSLCGDPADRSRYRFAVLREPDGRGTSVYLHDQVRPGDELYVSYPQDTFGLAGGAREHVLIAGGIGIAPLLAMLREVAAPARARLHYCVRSLPHAAFLDELSAIPHSTSLYRSDLGGRLDVARVIGELAPAAHLYYCGPPRLLAAIEAAAAAAGLPAERLHGERFFGLSRDRATHGEPFEAELAASRKRLHVPGDQSLLEVLRAAGVPIDSACEGGVCRTCKVEVLDGDVVHRDLCLSDRERETAILTCVSRGRGTVRLNV